MRNNVSETGSNNPKISLVELLKAVGAIVAVPIAAYTIINYVIEQPDVTFGIALITAIGASVYMVRYQGTTIRDIIIAWLVLTVAILAVFVVWPKTIIVEGIIADTFNNPVPNEEVRLTDVNGIPRTANTDTTGHYQFKDVPNGKYTITVRQNKVEGLAQGGLKRQEIINLTVPQLTQTSLPTLISAATETPMPISSPTSKPECRLNDLFKCSTLVPIYVEGESHLTTAVVSDNLIVNFSNDQNGSGVALVFQPRLNVQGFAYLEISGTSTQICTFLIEYKTRSGDQLTIVTTSLYQTFPATTSITPIRIPITFDGVIDEVVINFYNVGESSTIIIESMRLSP